jgi:hypothetical protein
LHSDRLTCAVTRHYGPHLLGIALRGQEARHLLNQVHPNALAGNHEAGVKLYEG